VRRLRERLLRAGYTPVPPEFTGKAVIRALNEAQTIVEQRSEAARLERVKDHHMRLLSLVADAKRALDDAEEIHPFGFPPGSFLRQGHRLTLSLGVRGAFIGWHLKEAVTALEKALEVANGEVVSARESLKKLPRAKRAGRPELLPEFMRVMFEHDPGLTRDPDAWVRLHEDLQLDRLLVRRHLTKQHVRAGLARGRETDDQRRARVRRQVVQVIRRLDFKRVENGK
jgi:hypothetical protein